MKRGTKGAWGAEFDTIETYVGGNVHRLRIEKGLTQTELAEKIGLEVTSLQRIEKGYGNCTARVLAALAAALQVGVQDFFGQAELLPRKRGRPKKVTNE